MPVLSKKFLDIQATIECVHSETRTWHDKNIQSYRNRSKIKAKQHFLGCLSFQKGPSIMYLHFKGREGVKTKACIYNFYDIILLFKSAQGGRCVWKLPNLSVQALWMVPNTFLTFNSENYRTINKISMKLLIFFSLIMK